MLASTPGEAVSRESGFDIAVMSVKTTMLRIDDQSCGLKSVEDYPSNRQNVISKRHGSYDSQHNLSSGMSVNVS